MKRLLSPPLRIVHLDHEAPAAHRPIPPRASVPPTKNLQTSTAPSPEEQQAAREAVAVLVAEAQEVGCDGGEGHLHVSIRGTDGVIGLPEVVRGVLQNVLGHFAAGRAVQVAAVETDLTTNEAARLLGVSRPYLIKLLDQKQIPHFKVNRHRRVRLEDLMAHRDRQHTERRRTLDELHRRTEDLGSYD